MEIVAMGKEFLFLSFSSQGDCAPTVLDGPWFVGKSGLFLKKWILAFNLEKESINPVLCLGESLEPAIGILRG